MPLFSANLSTLFKEAPLLERFSLAANAGFTAVEIQFPYQLSKSVIKEQLDKHDLSLNLINLPAGDIENGELGIACLPDRKAEFRESLKLAVEYASYLKVPKINCLAGIKPSGVDYKAAENTFLENLDYSCCYLKDLNIVLLIEAINTVDIKGFFLNNSDQAVELINRLGHINLKLQYDVYHMQIMEGNLITTMTDCINTIGHVQIADVPGRGEPGSGEINFLNIFNALDIMGYTDYIGLEYFPIKNTNSGLETIAPLLNLKGEQT